MFPVHVGGLELGCRRMAAIRDAHSAADTEPALGEVQSVAYGAADPVVRNPPDELGVEAAGEDQVLDESADLVVGKRRDDRAPQPECTPQPAGDVVLTTALAGSERPGSSNPPLAGVEPEHDLTERHDVIPALGSGTDGEGGHQRTPSVWAIGASCWAASATACDVSTVIAEKSPDAMRSRGTIHEPPTAITDARSRYSCRLSGPTPPVGTNRTPTNGAARSAMAAAPPEVPAGKNFTVVSPSSSAAWISVAVTAPGRASTFSFSHTATTERL